MLTFEGPLLADSAITAWCPRLPYGCVKADVRHSHLQHELRIPCLVLEYGLLDALDLTTILDVPSRVCHHAAAADPIIKRIVGMSVQP